MNFARRPLAIALLTLACSPLFAQSAKDGLTNSLIGNATLAVPVVSVPADVTASRDSDVGNLRTRGVSSGVLVQRQSGARSADQILSVAGVLGAVRVDDAQLGGIVTVDVQQLTRNAAEVTQRIGVGTLMTSTMASAATLGDISGRNVSQSNTTTAIDPARNSQEIAVASIAGTQASQVSASGSVTGGVQQVLSGSASGAQVLNAGSVANVDGGGQVAARGEVRGEVFQVASREVDQRIDVGSVTGGAPVDASTRAVVLASVTQRAEGGGLSGARQSLSVGSANGSGGIVRTDATLGSTSQTITFDDNVDQRIAVGSAEGSRTQAVTEVFHTGEIVQATADSSDVVQDVSIGSALNTAATATIRAEVTGNLIQFASASDDMRQTINLGSVRHIYGGSVSTDVTVSNVVFQEAGGASDGRQLVLIGGLEGNQ
ncbi:hypothetical protein [Nitrogeniibacter aestuarii]|uniref:hypothetical protein n=1 Tax=Nitrogeniibacter aestuarii TaxID=2815343 RepID=UPI001E28E26F|nr:hypothetical protein [Nitrogeniibacter aestuarii]